MNLLQRVYTTNLHKLKAMHYSRKKLETPGWHYSSRFPVLWSTSCILSFSCTDEKKKILSLVFWNVLNMFDRFSFHYWYILDRVIFSLCHSVLLGLSSKLLLYCSCWKMKCLIVHVVWRAIFVGFSNTFT